MRQLAKLALFRRNAAAELSRRADHEPAAPAAELRGLSLPVPAITQQAGLEICLHQEQQRHCKQPDLVGLNAMGYNGGGNRSTHGEEVLVDKGWSVLHA